MAKSKTLPGHIRALLAQFGRDKEAREAWIASNDALREALGYEWSFWRRPEQTAPLGNWRCWLILAGRWSDVLKASSVRIAGTQVIGPQQPPIAIPQGGTNPDTEARTAISMVINSLRAHGLISN